MSPFVDRWHNSCQFVSDVYCHQWLVLEVTVKLDINLTCFAYFFFPFLRLLWYWVAVYRVPKIRAKLLFIYFRKFLSSCFPITKIRCIYTIVSNISTSFCVQSHSFSVKNVYPGVNFSTVLLPQKFFYSILHFIGLETVRNNKVRPVKITPSRRQQRRRFYEQGLCL